MYVVYEVTRCDGSKSSNMVSTILYTIKRAEQGGQTMPCAELHNKYAEHTNYYSYVDEGKSTECTDLESLIRTTVIVVVGCVTLYIYVFPGGNTCSVHCQWSTMIMLVGLSPTT